MHGRERTKRVTACCRDDLGIGWVGVVAIGGADPIAARKPEVAEPSAQTRRTKEIGPSQRPTARLPK
jgi:hypothetical protein